VECSNKLAVTIIMEDFRNKTNRHQETTNQSNNKTWLLNLRIQVGL